MATVLRFTQHTVAWPTLKPSEGENWIKDQVSLSLEDEREGDGVTLVEWADRLRDELPPGRLDIAIEILPDERRRVVLRAHDARHRAYLEVA